MSETHAEDIATRANEIRVWGRSNPDDSPYITNPLRIT
ncbi:hypothetical protein M2226_003653 [Bradyrhizobium elkanii]|nr:hypothetical protein [Bradyrhizobium elkanii]MCW2171655.1 hypothetical protein [Bradyrhizobium elkanii]